MRESTEKRRRERKGGGSLGERNETFIRRE